MLSSLLNRTLSIILINILLGLGQVAAQETLPVIQSDSASVQELQLDYSFEKDTSGEDSFSEKRVNPSPLYRKGDINQQSRPEGDMVRVDLETGERTVIELPSENEMEPDSYEHDARQGTAQIPTEVLIKLRKRKKDQNVPETSKFTEPTQVNNPANISNRKFVKIRMKFPESNSACSGTLVDESWVLTAAHCIKLAKHGGEIEDARVMPGKFKKSNPYGEAEVASYFYFSNWEGERPYNFNADMGLLYLKRPIGVVTGYYPFDTEEKPFYQDVEFHTRSYPAEEEYDGEIMYKNRGQWDFGLKTGIGKPGSKQDILAHNGGVLVGGSSGGAAYAFDNGQKKVYAVVSHGKKNLKDKSVPPEFYTRVSTSKKNKMRNVIKSVRIDSADLVPLNVKTSQKTITQGKRLDKVSFTLFNRGTLPTAQKDWNYSIYLSWDRNIDTTDILLRRETFRYQFNGRETIEVEAEDVKIPHNWNYVGIIIDENDENPLNNNTEGWDSRKIKVKKGINVVFRSRFASGGFINRDETPIKTKNPDINGKYKGETLKYAEDSRIYVEANKYVNSTAIGEFSHWEDSAKIVSEKPGTYINVKADTALFAIYEKPDMPAWPPEISKRLPSDAASESKNGGSIVLYNYTKNEIEWELTKLNNSSWIEFDETSATIKAATENEYHFDWLGYTMNADELSKGGYTETIQITNEVGDTANVDVELVVGPKPDRSAPTSEEIAQDQVVGEKLKGLGFGAAMDFEVTPEKLFMGAGAPGPTDQPGRVMLRNWGGDDWTDFSTVMQPSLPAGSQFGSAMSFVMSGATPMMIAGAPGETGFGHPAAGMRKEQVANGQSYTGRAFIYTKNQGSWSADDTLQFAESLNDHAGFGASIDAENHDEARGNVVIAVGAPGVSTQLKGQVGRVYVFFMWDDEVQEVATLNPDIVTNGQRFGESVDVTFRVGDPYILVGAPGTDDTKGHAELFGMGPEGEWEHKKNFVPEDVKAGEYAGSKVAMASNYDSWIVTMGAPGGKEENQHSGSLYWYRHNNGSWNYDGSLEPDPDQIGLDEGTGLYYGKDIQIYSSSYTHSMMVGAPSRINTSFPGASYIYRLKENADSWSGVEQIVNDEISEHARFGHANSVVPQGEEMKYYASAPSAYSDNYANMGKVFQYELGEPVVEPEVTVRTDTIDILIKEDTRKEKFLGIESTGKSALSWELENRAPWIATMPDSGTVEAGRKQSVKLSFNSFGLDTGRYRSSITLYTNDTDKDTSAILVNMRVTDKRTPDLQIEEIVVNGPDTLHAGNTVGSGVEAELINSGTDPVDSTFAVGLYISRDTSITPNDTLVATTPIDTGLAVSEATTIPVPRATFIPHSFANSQAHLLFKADYRNEITELDTANNTATHAVVIGKVKTSRFVGIQGTDSVEVLVEKGKQKTTTIRFGNSGDASLDFSLPRYAESSIGNANSQSGSSLTVSVDSIPEFLPELKPAVGTIAPQDTATLTLNVTGKEVSTGIYRDTLILVTNDPDRTTVNVPVEVEIKESTSIAGRKGIPNEFALKGNYPNPFNPTTNIRFNLPKKTEVSLTVYNLLGRRVAEVVDRQMEPGRHAVTFNAANLASQMYLYRLKAGSFTATGKMVVIK